MEIKPLKGEELIKNVEDWSSVIDSLDLPEQIIRSFTILQRLANGEGVPYPDEDDSEYGFSAFEENDNGAISAYIEVFRTEKPFVQPDDSNELTGTPKVLRLMAERSGKSIDSGWIISHPDGLAGCNFSWNPETKEYDQKTLLTTNCPISK